MLTYFGTAGQRWVGSPGQVNERADVSVEMAEMAIRLSKGFGSSPETWLGLQMAYELWQARERMEHTKIREFNPA
jgi:plasmid maintenance system antidote protein VapI